MLDKDCVDKISNATSSEAILEKLAALVGYTHLEWFKELATEWQSLFEQISISSASKIVEFGPGYSPKIQFALLQTPFKGQLVQVDLDIHTLNCQRLVNDLLGAKFQLSTWQGDLFDYSLEGVDILVGNHLIDDLVGQAFVQEQEVDYRDLLSDVEAQRALWERIGQNSQRSTKILEFLADKITELGRNSVVVFNTYPSNFDLQGQLHQRVHCGIDFLRKGLRSALEEKGFGVAPQGVYLSEKIRDRKMEWLILTKLAN